jgi:Stealth protein CR2, conserved region 2/Stealth protein CR3, conserved region 3
MAEPIDAVYTWVDGTWPGYDALLRAHAHDRHDLNPNRYRDNLSLLKYSLRSLERYAPWIRRVILVTCRPQRPAWLNPQAVRVVHHDEFLPGEVLPTFNSFAIVSGLHRIPDLSRRFIYIEDDRLFLAAVRPEHFFAAADGKTAVVLQKWQTLDPQRASDERVSPWNRALARSNGLLDAKYGAKRRRTIGHVPLAVDRELWQAMIDQWREPFSQTLRSRFRATGNVAPEHLYPHYLLEEGRAVAVGGFARGRVAAYHPLNNLPAFQRLNLARIGLQRPVFLCLNDNFGERPHPRSVAHVARALDRWLPSASRFEVQ